MASTMADDAHSIQLLMETLQANKLPVPYRELIAAVSKLAAAASEVKAAWATAQATVRACQQEHLVLTQRIGELEKENAELKAWIAKRNVLN